MRMKRKRDPLNRASRIRTCMVEPIAYQFNHRMNMPVSGIFDAHFCTENEDLYERFAGRYSARRVHCTSARTMILMFEGIIHSVNRPTQALVTTSIRVSSRN